MNREDVEDLLADALHPNADYERVPADQLAELCRAWLAVDGAPVGYALMGRGDWIEVFNMGADDRHAVEGQRVRIVKEAGDD